MSQTGQIQAPLKGEPPRASWAQSITEAVNSMLPFSAPGRLLRAGFGGTGSVPVPENKRQRSSALALNAVTGAGCYELVEVEETEGGQTVTKKYLSNQYYVDGGVIKSTSFSNPLDPATHYGKFIALRAPMTSNGTAALAAYDTFALMHTASLDPNFVTIALYQLDANGGIVCDFRNIPHAQAFENLS
ncbi:MAG: hypothetical protein II823_07080 [Kiritimatiellae bacterium]|nr:hypothetical protein [Kiritimatiellia bacterium]